jgi:hypothetical protein
MRTSFLAVAAFALVASPAMAGEVGGCNWAKKQVTAEAPVAAPLEAAAMPSDIVETARVWPVIEEGRTVEQVARMIEATPVTVQ